MPELMNASEHLGKLPNNQELERLVKYYPSYGWEHRTKLLYGYFESKTIAELLSDKLKAKGINESKLSPQAKGAHIRWVIFKVKRTIIRLLYLRLRLDEGFSKIKANQELVKLFGPNQIVSDPSSAIRKATHTKILP